jgi:hypothetical protein
VQCIIQSVPQRRQNVERVILPAVRKAIGVEPEIWEDPAKLGARGNFMRIMEDVAGRSSPVLYFQDDVILHRDAGRAVAELGRLVGDSIQAISLFLPPQKRLDQIAAKGFNMVQNHNFLWMPGMIFCPAFAKALCGFAPRTSTSSADGLVKRFVWWSGVPVWNCIPSVVQHNCNLASSMGHPQNSGAVPWMTRQWVDTIPAGHFAEIRSVVIKARPRLDQMPP